jgi:hypothetical protein
MAQDTTGTGIDIVLGPIVLGLFLLALFAVTALVALIATAFRDFRAEGASILAAGLHAAAYVLLGGPLRALRPVARRAATHATAALGLQMADLADVVHGYRVRRVHHRPSATLQDKIAVLRPATVSAATTARRRAA